VLLDLGKVMEVEEEEETEGEGVKGVAGVEAGVEVVVNSVH